MRTIHWVLLAAMSMTMVGSAEATIYTVDVTVPVLDEFTSGDRFSSGGYTSFPALTLLFGDSAIFDATFSQPLTPILSPPTKLLGLFYVFLNVHQHSTIPDTNGMDHFYYPYFPNYTPEGFSFEANILGPSNANASVTLDSISYELAPVPELSTWAMMVIGLATLVVARSCSRRTLFALRDGVANVA